jgi:hypothetical protein
METLGQHSASDPNRGRGEKGRIAEVEGMGKGPRGIYEKAT